MMGDSMAATWSQVLEADDPKAVLEATDWVTLVGFCELKGEDVKDLDLTGGKADLIAHLLPHVESERAGEEVSSSSISATRKRMQDKFEKVSEAASERVRRAKEQDGAAGSVIKVTEKTVRRGKNVVQTAVNTAVDKSARSLSFEKYRDELEHLLDEAVRVIAVQEDRIARLEEQLGDANT